MTDRTTVPTDPLALRMENDLLTLEVDLLRGSVEAFKTRAQEAEAAGGAEATARVGELEDELAGCRGELARAARHLATERERVEELRQARSDLRWLLERLGGSPAGPLLRRFGGFSTLEQRWLDT